MNNRKLGIRVVFTSENQNVSKKITPTREPRGQAGFFIIEALEARTLLSTYEVNSLADDGSGGTLRAAIAQANTATDGDQYITFDSSLTANGPATISLNGTALELNGSSGTIKVIGPTGDNGIIIDAQQNSGAFQIDGGSVELDNLTITGGSANTGAGILNNGFLSLNACKLMNNSAVLDGGAVANSGAISIANSVFYDNTAQGNGGALVNYNLVNQIAASSFSFNSAGVSGGAIENEGLAIVMNSTLDDNFCAAAGGAVHSSAGNVDIFASTITGNHAQSAAGISIDNGTDAKVFSTTLVDNISSDGAGGIDGTGHFEGEHSIIASNSPADIGGDLQMDGTYNLVGDGTGNFSGDASQGNILGSAAAPIDPELAPLGQYGGPTLTMPLLPDSPALAAGPTSPDYASQFESTDQRGFPLPTGTPIDIGAFQSVPILVNTLPSDVLGAGQIDFPSARMLSDALGGQPIGYARTLFPGDYSPYGALWVTWPTSVAEGADITVPVSNGSELAIEGWTLNWLDASGNVVYSDSLDNPDGSFSYNAGSQQQLTIQLAAYDYNNVTYALPAWTIGVTPNAPTDLSPISTSSGDVALSWTDNSSISTQDTVYVSTDNGLSFYSIDTVTPASSGGDNSFDITGLNSGSEYAFYLTADTGYASSSPTGEVIASTPGISEVENLAASPASPNDINLSWSVDSESLATTNKIQYSTDGINFTDFDSVDGNTTSYQVDGLVPNTAYYFRVIAEDDNGNQSTPAAAQATTEVDPWGVGVTGPTSIEEGLDYQLSLSATSLASGSNSSLDHWTVDWGDGSQDTYPANTTEATHAFAAGTSFASIQVTASTASPTPGESGTSSTMLTVTAAPIWVDVIPAPPVDLNAQLNDSSTEVNLSWSDNSSLTANGYDVFRSDGGGTFNLIGQVAAGATSYLDDGISGASSNTLQYEVEAVGDSQQDISAPSTSTYIETARAPVFTAAPDTDSLTAVDLTWSYSQGNESGFVIQMADQTLNQTPYTALASNQNSATITGITPGDIYLFQIWATYSAGGTSAVSNTEYYAPESSNGGTTPSATVVLSLNSQHEHMSSYNTAGTWVLGATSGDYSLFEPKSGNSTLGNLVLGKVANSRGEAVVKGGTLTVGGTLLVGNSGYGSFTNAGGNVAVGAFNIAEGGHGSTNSYFNQISGSTSAGIVDVGSNYPQDNAGLLAIEGGNFNYTGTLSVQGSGSTLDIQGTSISTGLPAHVSCSGSGIGLVVGAGTQLEFDPTSDSSNISYSIPELNLGNSLFDAQGGSELTLNLTNYHRTSTESYTLIQAGGVAYLNNLARVV